MTNIKYLLSPEHSLTVACHTQRSSCGHINHQNPGKYCKYHLVDKKQVQRHVAKVLAIQTICC